MSTFRATNTKTGEVVEYEADKPRDEHRAAPWDLAQVFVSATSPADPPPDTRMFLGRRRLTKLEFIALLGQTAYGAILTAAKTEIAVEMWVKMMDLATPDSDGTSINLDDPRTQYGVQALGGMLAQMKVVPAEWAATVLAG